LAVLVIGLLLIGVLGLVVALSRGGGGGSKLNENGPAVATVIEPTPVKQRAPRHPFKPSPRAAALVRSLPLPRQVAQLFLVKLFGKTPRAVGTLGSTDWAGVVLDSSNFANDRQVGRLARAITSSATKTHNTSRLIAATQEGGPRTAFRDLPPKPEPVIGASGRPALAGAQARQAGQRLRSLGLNMTLAPLADVDSASGPLSGRLFSTDASVVAQLTRAAVAGYAQVGMISAIGHFPGAGGASGDPDQTAATVGGTLAELEGRDLIPFAAVSASAPVILMSNAAYVAFDGVTPAALLPRAVKLLRDSYGYQGVVMSDDLDATLQPTGDSAAAAAVQALNAGDDLLYISGSPAEQLQAYDGVLNEARKSAATRARVRDALLRVLTLKVRYGIVR
jgi:beta-N-acetylhexosaminidase